MTNQTLATTAKPVVTRVRWKSGESLVKRLSIVWGIRVFVGWALSVGWFASRMIVRMSDSITDIQTPTPVSPRIALVVSRYNDAITDKLEAGAREALTRLSPRAEMDVFPAPGAFELVAVAGRACESGAYDGVAVLGCVVRGETRHDEYINQSVSRGITDLTVRTGVPVSFGLLTVENRSQAEARAGGVKGNKGAEAVEAVLASIASIRAVDERASELAKRHRPVGSGS